MYYRGGGESHCFLILKIIILSNPTNTFFRSDSQMNTIQWCILWIGITGALMIVPWIRKEARMLAPTRELQHYLLSEGRTKRRGALKEKQRPPQATSTSPFSHILRSHLSTKVGYALSTHQLRDGTEQKREKPSSYSPSHRDAIQCCGEGGVSDPAFVCSPPNSKSLFLAVSTARLLCCGRG